MLCRSDCLSFSPLNKMLPESAVSILLMSLINVVFPAPLGPKRPKISPSLISIDIFSKAVFLKNYLFNSFTDKIIHNIDILKVN